MEGTCRGIIRIYLVEKPFLPRCMDKKIGALTILQLPFYIFSRDPPATETRPRLTSSRDPPDEDTTQTSIVKLTIAHTFTSILSFVLRGRNDVLLLKAHR